MTAQQAQPPTDAEQVQTLRTANAQLRQRVKEQEQIAIELRTELDELRASAELSVTRWMRSEQERRAFVEAYRQAEARVIELLLSIDGLLIERGMLEHRLGEAHQTMNVMEETV